MITPNKQKTIKEFYQTVVDLQSAGPKEIGLLVIEKETIADLAALSPKSNQTTIFDLKRDINLEQIIKNLAEAVSRDNLILIRLYDYLHPKIYNQLYLLSKNGRMDFIETDKDNVVTANKKSALVLISTNDDLEKNNYQNILDLTAVVKKL